MTDFGPLIANPKSFLLGAAAQGGIFFTFVAAALMGMSAAECGSIAIIGGADGPTAISLTDPLSPLWWGVIIGGGALLVTGVVVTTVLLLKKKKK